MENHMLNRDNIKAVAATDFDGTLYRSDYTVSPENINTLNMLGEKHILRVIVTGRTFFSLTGAIDKDFPVDYYIVSSGSGVYSKKLEKLIYRTSLPLKKARAIGSLLLSMNCDFMVHETLPDNHFFSFHRSGLYNEDFEARLLYYKDHGREIDDLSSLNDDISQFLVIEKPGSILFELLREKLKDCTVIRTTSPLDHQSSWIEIFPPGTDKGSTLRWLAAEYGLSREKVFTIGNDYNDLHMLRWARYAYVVDNAAVPLKEEFSVVPGNDEDGFTEAVRLWLKAESLL